jgi:UDP-GlcNAc3NAcA epimerase
MHPRTKNLFDKSYGFREDQFPNIKILEPQGYFENLKYLMHSEALITDSGGMQKEAYFLEKRCITLRPETEWTETLLNKCNVLVWDNIDQIKIILNQPAGPFIQGIYGDGKAAEKMTLEIVKQFQQRESV